MSIIEVEIKTPEKKKSKVWILFFVMIGLIFVGVTTKPEQPKHVNTKEENAAFEKRDAAIKLQYGPNPSREDYLNADDPEYYAKKHAPYVRIAE